MLHLDPDQLEFIRETSWPDVLAAWRENEAHQSRWIERYTQSGFASWEEWRSNHVAPLKPDKRNWALYRVHDPLRSIPGWHGGPFTAWKKKYYGDQDSLKFTELAQLPAIQENPVIKQLIAQFPTSTSLIGLMCHNRIVVLEGMHRCSALALAALQGIRIETDVTIALADFSGESIPLLDSTKRQP